MLRFGTQDDYQGLLGGSPDADRSVGYLCKYLTKSIAGTYDDPEPSPARQAHIDRLAEQVRWLIRSGELRSVTIGKSRRVSATALADYVAQLDEV